VTIAIVGDRNPGFAPHAATDSAFADLDIETRWILTSEAEKQPPLLAETDLSQLAMRSVWLRGLAAMKTSEGYSASISGHASSR
jgi:hypothetical protein